MHEQYEAASFQETQIDLFGQFLFISFAFISRESPLSTPTIPDHSSIPIPFASPAASRVARRSIKNKNRRGPGKKPKETNGKKDGDKKKGENLDKKDGGKKEENNGKNDKTTDGGKKPDGDKKGQNQEKDKKGKKGNNDDRGKNERTNGRGKNKGGGNKQIPSVPPGFYKFFKSLEFIIPFICLVLGMLIKVWVKAVKGLFSCMKELILFVLFLKNHCSCCCRCLWFKCMWGWLSKILKNCICKIFCCCKFAKKLPVTENEKDKLLVDATPVRSNAQDIEMNLSTTNVTYHVQQSPFRDVFV